MALLDTFWQQETSENLDAFLTELGIPDELKEKLLEAKPKFKIEQNGDEYTSTSIIGDKERVVNFTSGVEYEDEPIPGVVMKSTVIVAEDVIAYIQRTPSGKIVTQRRELEDDKMKITLRIDGWEGEAYAYLTKE